MDEYNILNLPRIFFVVVAVGGVVVFSQLVIYVRDSDINIIVLVFITRQNGTFVVNQDTLVVVRL